MRRTFGALGGLVGLSTLILAAQGACAGEKVIFAMKRGKLPYAGVIEDSKGNLYGTTSAGGGGGGGTGSGTVYEVSSKGKATTLYKFGKHDGDPLGPYAGLMMDSSGNLYGTATGGGANGLGAVFKLAPNGKLTVLHSFAGGSDGSYPDAGLIADSEGNLYGTTTSGGMTCSGTGNGCGTVYKISSSGTESVLYAFQGSPNDGSFPVAGLVMDGEGNLYGTTVSGGNAFCEGPEGDGGCGTVFKLTPGGAESMLYSFQGGDDGAIPFGTLIMDSEDNLYGTAEFGGANGGGSVFEIAPNGAETTVYSFQEGGSGDGIGPLAGLWADEAGDMFGTTVGGGTHDKGTVFELPAGGGETVLYSFVGGKNDGALPYAGVIGDGTGDLFGTTYEGGSGQKCAPGRDRSPKGYGCGVVYEIAGAFDAKKSEPRSDAR
jgi:uncharacterized repeat protein (TIGR03803 family)